MTANLSMVDGIWILICTGLVFAMQAGFLCLESGLTRNKNAINVALKNMTDFSVSMLLFWVLQNNSWVELVVLLRSAVEPLGTQNNKACFVFWAFRSWSGSVVL